jgi:hypothetical protein
MNNLLPPMLQGIKVSDVFMQYSEPFLSQLLLDRDKQGEAEPTLQELDTVLRIPWCIWNAIVAESAPSNDIDFLAWMDTLTCALPTSIKSLLDFMQKRKRQQFSQFKYYLGNYTLYYVQNNELRIRVEARSASR